MLPPRSIKAYLVILKMILESMLYQDMETSLTPILKKVFLLLVKKQINALHGKLYLIKFTMTKLKNKLFIKMHGYISTIFQWFIFPDSFTLTQLSKDNLAS